MPELSGTVRAVSGESDGAALAGARWPPEARGNAPSGRTLKVLLVGHACSPGRGSEPGLTWNWAWHLSARHEVWVLAHPEYREHVERFLAARPNPRLHFVWVTLPQRWDPWNASRGLRGIRLHYLVWQRIALHEAARLHRVHRFDLAHYVSWNTISAPPMFWRLPAPLVWGPVGGGMTTPSPFRRYFGRASWREALRTVRVRLLPILPLLRRTVRRSALVLATNVETAELLKAAGASDVRLFFDNGLPPDYLPPAAPERDDREVLTLLWAGKLEPRKALPLALEALARVKDLPVRLLVAGDGPARAQWQAVRDRLGLSDRVEFVGAVPWEGMPELFRRADAFLFTSLRDSAGTVVLEAMAHALPIIALDHQGVGCFLPPAAGIKVPVTTPNETVGALAEAIREVVGSRETRLGMGRAAWSHARGEAWDRRADRMTAWYEECLARPS